LRLTNQAHGSGTAISRNSINGPANTSIIDSKTVSSFRPSLPDERKRCSKPHDYGYCKHRRLLRDEVANAQAGVEFNIPIVPKGRAGSGRFTDFSSITVRPPNQ
jgi:hypothetical protein